MTTYGTFDIDSVPAPSDFELAPITLIVAPPVCTCDNGNVKAPDGTWEFCIHCPEGIELELQRISRCLLGLAERMAEIRVLIHAGTAKPFEFAESRACAHSHRFLCDIHDKLEIKQTALKAVL